MLSVSRAHSLLEYNKDTGLFRWKQKRGGPQSLEWRRGCPDGKGYHVINIEGTLYRTHRLAWFMSYGEWPKNQIDHINADKSDNRLCNLRDVSANENAINHHYHRKLNGKPHWKQMVKTNRINEEVSI